MSPKPSLYMLSSMTLLVTGARTLYESKAMLSSMALLVTGTRTLYESKAFTIHARFHGSAGYWC